MCESKYIFVTFAPIQGFIEKSRKLRDLYGASLILSYLSTEILKAAKQNARVISPGLPGFSRGMPNRILVKGHFSEEAAREALIKAWGKVLEQCRTYLEREINQFLKDQGKPVYSYTWEPEWDKWKNHTWELFWGEGNTPDEARENLERRKLSRRWTAINWIGDSSSLSGADPIAYPRLEAKDIKVNSDGFSSGEKELVEEFYTTLAALFDGNKEWEQDTENFQVEGKFIAENERLSIPELVKRLVTHRKVGNSIGILPPENFNDIVRLARNTEQDIQGHWTGWFMGDGDRMGDHLKTLAQKSDDEIYKFSEIIRNWGKDFDNNFPRQRGRVIYAGGDDFLGIIYSGKPEEISKILAKFPLLRTLESLVRLLKQQQLLQQVARRLKKAERLERRVAIYVPTTVDVNVPADTSLHVEQTLQLMAQLFGGATWSEQEGLYMSNVAGMVREKNIVVRSNTTTEVLYRHLPTLVGFVGELQYELRQETMAMELDGEMLLLQFA
jgi:CRISPR-associated protein Cmr2